MVRSRSTPYASPRGSQQHEQTAERRLAGWQRARRWAAWLEFLGLAVWTSKSGFTARRR